MYTLWSAAPLGCLMSVRLWLRDAEVQAPPSSVLLGRTPAFGGFGAVTENGPRLYARPGGTAETAIAHARQLLRDRPEIRRRPDRP
jgi:hypothetical protein